jgi:maltooligosyltrehalose synthase
VVWTAAAQGKAHDEAHDELIARISAYIAKATKEAKVHTSWVNPNEDYDRALSKFVSAILKPGSHLRFLNKFAPLLQRVAYYGQFNALAQLLLKLTALACPTYTRATSGGISAWWIRITGARWTASSAGNCWTGSSGG